MHAFLISASDQTDRTALLDALVRERGVTPLNCSVLLPAPEESTIGIEAVRLWQQELALSPVGGGARAGVVPDAQRLTPAAQQAILKTLEEPPGQAIIILSVDNPATLLPTIRSRCVMLSGAKKPSKQSPAPALPTSTSPGGALAAAEEIAETRQGAQQWIEEVLRTPVTPGNARALSNARVAYERLAANVNPKLVIDAFLLSLYNDL